MCFLSSSSSSSTLARAAASASALLQSFFLYISSISHSFIFDSTFFCISSLAYSHSTFFFPASAKALALVSEASELLDLLEEDDLVVVQELISSFSNMKMYSQHLFLVALLALEDQKIHYRVATILLIKRVLIQIVLFQMPVNFLLIQF